MKSLSGKDTFVLDSNTFIAPYRNYYAMDHFPSYWSWLKDEFAMYESKLVLPKIVYAELTSSPDRLANWVRAELQPFVYVGYENEPLVWGKYQQIINFIHTSGYFTGAGISNWDQNGKADPLLIAMAAAYGWKIVTFEQSAGRLSKKNPTSKEPKIPDVAAAFEVDCVDIFLLEEKFNLVI